MKTNPINFDIEQTQNILEVRWVLAISMDDANTDITYITSHSDALDPGGVAAIDRIDGALNKISGQTQRINPDVAASSIGAVSFRITDVSGEFTTKLKTKLDGGEGLRKKRIQLYKGFEGLAAWSDYALRLTFIIDDVSYKNGIYILKCNDIQRTSKQEIFEGDVGVLTATIGAADATIPVTVANAATKFPLVEHDLRYSSNAPIERAVDQVDLTTINWTKTAVTITPNAVVGPFNLTDADQVVMDGTINPSYEQQYETNFALSNTTWRIEVWLRTDAGQPTAFDLRIQDSAGADIGTAPGVMTTEWQKFIFYHTFGATVPSTIVVFGVDLNQPAVLGEYLYHGGVSFYKRVEVGYVKIDDEVICHQGWTDGTFTALSVVQRGALNTIPVGHTVTAAEEDQKKRIEEYVFLEMPTPKMVYAILTGIVTEASLPLPDHWNLAIDPAFVTQSNFTGIGRDLWDTRNNTGRTARFLGLDKQDGKQFIERELLLWMGCFMPIFANGAYGLKRLVSVLPASSTNATIDGTQVTRYGDLKHDMRVLINNIVIRWNWIDSLERFTKTTALVDSNSIGLHGKANIAEYEFKGVFTGTHSDNDIRNYFQQIRERYSNPPLRLSITCLPRWDNLDVGDKIRLTLPEVIDYNTNTGLDRAFEIQQVKTDWTTGLVTLDLFGGISAVSNDVLSNDFVMQDAFYTSQGTELSTVLTIVGGAVTANGTLTGADDHNNAVYYYVGDLTINAGVTVNCTENVQLRIRGSLTINGTLTTKGGHDNTGFGAAGTGATDNYPNSSPRYGQAPGTGKPGDFGSTVITEALNYYHSSTSSFPRRVYWSAILNTWGGRISWDLRPRVEGTYPQLPAVSILNPDGLSLQGLLPSYRGCGGSGGMHCVGTVTGGNPYSLITDGGVGGNGGGGLVLITRGTFFGGSGIIETDGGDGNLAPSGSFDGRILHGGPGGGGYPGAVLVLIDGNASTPSTLNFRTRMGLTPFPAVDRVLTYCSPINFQCSSNRISPSTPGQSHVWGELVPWHGNQEPKNGLVFIGYIPPPQAGFEWFPNDEQTVTVNPDNSVPTGGSPGQVLIVNPDGTTTWADPGVQTAIIAYCPGYEYNFIDADSWYVQGTNVEQVFSTGRRLKFIETGNGAEKFGEIQNRNFNVDQANDTVINMIMQDGATLNANAHEVCLVTSAAGWSPIVVDPLAGDAIRGIATGQIGVENFFLIVGDNGKAAWSTNGGVGWTALTTGTIDNLVGAIFHPVSNKFYFVGGDDQGVYEWDGVAAAASQVVVPWATQAGDTMIGITYSVSQNGIIVTVHDSSGGNTIQGYTTLDEFLTQSLTKSGGTQQSLTVRHRWAVDQQDGSSGRLDIGSLTNLAWYSSIADTTVSSDGPFDAAISAVDRFRPTGLAGAITWSFVGLQNGDLVVWDGADQYFDKNTLNSQIRGFSRSIFHQRILAFGDNAGMAWIDDKDVKKAESWTYAQNGFGPTANVTCAAFNEDQGIWVACADNGQICRSGTGISNPRVIPANTGFTSLQTSPFGGTQIKDIVCGLVGATNRWLAVGGSGKAFYSDNKGVSWTACTITASTTLNCCAYDETNQEFMIGGLGGETWHSTDGITFSSNGTAPITSLALGGTSDVLDLEYFLNGAYWNAIIVTVNSRAKISSNTDGASWTADDTAGAPQVITYDEVQVGIPRLRGGTGSQVVEYQSATDATPTNIINVGYDILDIVTYLGDTAAQLMVVGANGGCRISQSSQTISTQLNILTGNITCCAYSPSLDAFIFASDIGEIAYLNGVYKELDDNAVVLTGDAFDNSGFTKARWNALDGIFMLVNQTGQIATSTTGIDP